MRRARQASRRGGGLGGRRRAIRRVMFGGQGRDSLWRKARGRRVGPTLALVLLLAALVSLAPSGPASAAPSGLVAAYGFDEGSGTTVADTSGNGNNGTVANTTWAATGKYGKALSFNGTNALVTIPDAATLHLSTAMTLEAWVNPTTVSGDLARRGLQGQRQLLPLGDVVLWRQAGGWRDHRRHVRGGVRDRRTWRRRPGRIWR